MNAEWPKEAIERPSAEGQWTCPAWRELGAESHEFILLSFSVTIGAGNALAIEFLLTDSLRDERWEVTFSRIAHLILNTVFNEPSSYDDAYEVGHTAIAGDVFTIGIGSGSAAFVAADGGWIQRIG